MIQKMLVTLEIDDSALDAAQAKADKLELTLKKIQERIDMLAGVEPQSSDAETRRAIIRWEDDIDKVVASAKPAPPADDKIHKLWQEAFEKGLVAIPPPEQSQVKEKPPEGGKSTGNVEVKDWTPPEGYGSCAHAWDANFWKQAAESNDFYHRLATVKALAAKTNNPAIDEVINNVVRDIFKPPD